MAKALKIVEYRERLDRTLASPKLVNHESLRSLLKNQIQRASGQETEGCAEKVIEKRTAEVANFLDMLRSVGSKACENPTQPEWKVKQDNEEFRVMYREGPVGVPLHTLLVEGYVDGPIDVCLCISLEAALYSKWWPQTTIPTFKILSSKCLQSVRDGEQISLLRVKVSWPLSTREAIIHNFLFEYLEDDLLVVLLNTVSDSETIDMSTHGFTREAIPKPKDVVRIDVVGGFALQKVTAERSYFRTIASMDVKLDFVPPALINFVSRQLIGNGFRLYQKAVTSRFTTDEDFSKALQGSLYAWVRKLFNSKNQTNGFLEKKEELESNEGQTQEDLETAQNLAIVSPEEHEASNNLDAEVGKKFSTEIEELKSEEESKCFDDQVLIEKITEISPVSEKRGTIISLEVEQALGTLDKVISKVKLYGFNDQLRSSYGFANDRTLKENNHDNDDSKSLEVKLDSDLKPHATKLLQESAKNTSSITNSREAGSNSFSKEVNHNKIAPFSSAQKLYVPSDTNLSQVNFCSAGNAPTEKPILNLNTQIAVLGSGLSGGKSPGQAKSHKLCCFGLVSQKRA